MTSTMLTQAAAVAVTGFLALLVGGCGAASSFIDEPDATLEDARLIGLTTSTMDIELDFLIDNPNDYDLPISNIAWNLNLWGEPFTEGITELEEDVPSGESPLIVPLTLALDDVASGVEKLLDGEPIPYTVDGDLTVETGAGDLAIPYDKPGEWENPLNDIPLP